MRPERRRCKEAADLRHVDLDRVESGIRRFKLVDQESRPLGRAGIERQPGTFAEGSAEASAVHGSRGRESIIAARVRFGRSSVASSRGYRREHVVRDRVHELLRPAALEIRGRPVDRRIPVTRDEVVERALDDERVLEAASEAARQLDPLAMQLPRASRGRRRC